MIIIIAVVWLVLGYMFGVLSSRRKILNRIGWLLDQKPQSDSNLAEANYLLDLLETELGFKLTLWKSRKS